MIYRVPAYDPKAAIAVIGIGNTNISVATSQDAKLTAAVTVPTSDAAAFEEAYDAHLEATPKGRVGATVVGSVVPEALERVAEFALKRTDKDVLIVGETIPYSMDLEVTDRKSVGTDRVCGAAMAYETLQAGCTVVSFGSAVTVDLVDDEGSFLGGAILPGIRMQLRALHEGTAQLPEIKPAFPALPFGRNTSESIQTGVCRGLAGAVRGIVEGYATHLNRWPQVVATGGDLPFMLPHCDFLDTAVADLVLKGIALAYTKHAESMSA